MRRSRTRQHVDEEGEEKEEERERKKLNGKNLIRTEKKITCSNKI